MRRESKKFLFDIDEACRAVRDFTKGKTFEDYRRDFMLRSGVPEEYVTHCAASFAISSRNPS